MKAGGNLVDFESGQPEPEIAWIDAQFPQIEVGSDNFRQACDKIHVVIQGNDPPSRIRFPQDREDNLALSVQGLEKNSHGLQFQIPHRFLGHLHSFVLGSSFFQSLEQSPIGFAAKPSSGRRIQHDEAVRKVPLPLLIRKSYVAGKITVDTDILHG